MGQKEARDAEYDSYVRLFIRAVPPAIAWILCQFLYDGIEIYKNLGWVLIFHIVIELTYVGINKDTKLFSILTWAAWGWFIYIWHIDSYKSFYYAMLPPLLVLLTIFRLSIWINIYRERKRSIQEKN